MSIRIDAGLKAKGDASLAVVGYTPTRAVRALWAFAARNENRPEKVEKLLREAEGEDSPAEQRARKMRLAEAGPAIFDDFLKAAGVERQIAFEGAHLTPAEEHEQAAVERALGKELIDG